MTAPDEYYGYAEPYTDEKPADEAALPQRVIILEITSAGRLHRTFSIMSGDSIQLQLNGWLEDPAETTPTKLTTTTIEIRVT